MDLGNLYYIGGFACLLCLIYGCFSSAPIYSNTWLNLPFFSPLAFAEPVSHASVKIRHSSTDVFCKANPECICKAGEDQLINCHVGSAAEVVITKGGSIPGTIVLLQLATAVKELASQGLSPGRPGRLLFDLR